MGTLATYFNSQPLTQITTGTSIAGSPTSVFGMAYASFQVIGLNTGSILTQGTLAMAATGSPTWVAMSVTNVNSNVVQGAIVADGLYKLSTAQGASVPYFAFIRPFVTTLSIVNDARLDVFCYRQAEVTGSN